MDEDTAPACAPEKTDAGKTGCAGVKVEARGAGGIEGRFSGSSCCSDLAQVCVDDSRISCPGTQDRRPKVPRSPQVLLPCVARALSARS